MRKFAGGRRDVDEKNMIEEDVNVNNESEKNTGEEQESETNLHIHNLNNKKWKKMKNHV